MRYDSALVVGAGAIAINLHLPRVRDILGCATVDIFDRSADRIGELRKRYEGDKGISFFLEPPQRRYDLILITTPPRFHLEYFSQFIQNTDTFIVEKPLAMTQAECEQICSAARKQDKRVFVPLIRRTLPVYGLLKSLRESQEFGELLRAEAFEGGVFGWEAVSRGSFSRELNGGGVLMDTGPHTLDLLCRIFNELEVGRAFVDAFPPAVEANCELQLVGDGRFPIDFAVSRNRNFSNEILLHFERAVLRVGVRSNRIRVRGEDIVPYDIVPESVVSCEDPSFQQLFDAFYTQYIMTGANADVGPSHSRNIARLIDTAYANAQPIKGGS